MENKRAIAESKALICNGSNNRVISTASATLDLLAQSIAQTQAIADAGEASIQEIKRNWNLHEQSTQNSRS